MSILNKIKKNQVIADAMKYKYVIAGRPKSGKTTLVYNVVKEKYNQDISKLLLIAFERGYNALKDVNVIDIEEFDEFVELVDELVENKDESGFSVVAIDTVDIMAKKAEKYALRKLSIADKKTYKYMGDPAYGKAYNTLDEVITEQIDRLDKAGYSLIFVTHDKDKEFKTKDGEAYNKTTLSLSGRVRDIILNMVDFICFIDVVKVGDEMKRFIHFRGDSSLEAGTRFNKIAEKIEYSPTGFIKTIEKAIMDEYNGDTKAVEKAMEEQNKEFEAKANDYIEKQKAIPTVEEAQAMIGELVQKFNDEDSREKIIAEFKSVLGTANYKKVDDLQALMQVINFLETL